MNIGHVTRIARYPFKSMAAESISQAYLLYSGLQGDRTFALIGSKARKSFPWLSIRECPELVLFKPIFKKMPHPENLYPCISDYELEVEMPDGCVLTSSDPEFEHDLRICIGHDCNVRFSERSMVDARPISILSEQTLKTAQDEFGQVLDWRRFRVNFMIDWYDLPGFGEDAFIDQKLLIGDKVEIHISKKDPRCATINVDPLTGIRNHNILKYIVREREQNMGIYAVTLREGDVKVGDSVSLIK